jgi:site-specific DNA recombinase
VTKLIAYSYARVSTENQEAEGTSLESQTAAIKAYAASKGFEVVQEFREVFTGAELWERPVLNQIRADVRARKVQAVIAFAIDRLSRDVAHLAILYDEAERHGCQLLLATEEIDNTAEGKLLRSVRGYVAEVERQKIKERTIRGKRSRLASGKIHGSGRELYGYVRDKEKGVRLVVEDEAATVRQIFEAVGSGQSLYSTMHRLNDSGTPAPFAAKGGKASPWSAATIRMIIKNPNYKGESVSWRTKGRKNGSVEWLAPSEWVHLPDGTTPAIVTPEQWEAANVALRANVGDATRNQSRPYLLRGFLFCSVCGLRCYPLPPTTNGRGGSYRYYRCASVTKYHRQQIAEHCGAGVVPADAVEAWAWAEVVKALADPEHTAAILTAVDGAQSSQARSETAALSKTLAKLEQSKARLLKRLRIADDDIAPLIEAELREVENERKLVGFRLAEAEAATAAQSHAVFNRSAVVSMLQALAKVASEATFDEKRDILRALQARITANGRTWSISYAL